MFLVMGLAKASSKLVTSKKNETKPHPGLNFLPLAWGENKKRVGFFST